MASTFDLAIPGRATVSSSVLEELKVELKLSLPTLDKGGDPRIALYIGLYLVYNIAYYIDRALDSTLKLREVR